MKVQGSLLYGRENAIPSKVLAEALGYPSTRELQKQIERERAAGAVILSDSHGGGYYLSNDPDELRRFTRTLNARAKNDVGHFVGRNGGTESRSIFFCIIHRARSRVQKIANIKGSTSKHEHLDSTGPYKEQEPRRKDYSKTTKTSRTYG